MADTEVYLETQPIKQIAIDYTPEACNHCPECNSISLTYDHRGGARWRSTTRFLYGTFRSLIQCPKGNTSGLNFNIYLSSLEGDKSQDEIDFEFLGKNKTIVETNYYTSGTGNREESHVLGFDCSDGFHEYVIKWFPNFIEWLIDGKVVRKVIKKSGGEGFPDQKPMFLYASVWDASYVDKARWTGPYVGCDAPYVCLYKNIRVPARTAVKFSSHHETRPINKITIDYNPEGCSYSPDSNSITLTYDHRGGPDGSRWRSTTRFLYGTFSSLIKCPKGNTSGLNFNIYLSTLEGDKSADEINFQFLGKDKTIIETNYTTVTGSEGETHNLGFDCSGGFQEYAMKWYPNSIEWLVDGKVIRNVVKEEGKVFPEKPMFLYASIWDASSIEEARWTGPYVGSDAPYVCLYKDIRVPVGTARDPS